MKFYFVNDKNNMHCKISGPAGLPMLEIANKMAELGYRPTNRIKYLGFTFKKTSETKQQESFGEPHVLMEEYVDEQ
jgi:hypothetical protein